MEREGKEGKGEKVRREGGGVTADTPFTQLLCYNQTEVASIYPCPLVFNRYDRVSLFSVVVV